MLQLYRVLEQPDVWGAAAGQARDQVAGLPSSLPRPHLCHRHKIHFRHLRACMARHCRPQAHSFDGAEAGEVEMRAGREKRGKRWGGVDGAASSSRAAAAAAAERPHLGVPRDRMPHGASLYCCASNWGASASLGARSAHPTLTPETPRSRPTPCILKTDRPPGLHWWERR